ncbi:MAG TPA: hypothetical protein VF169_24490 [Albitalea sp.]|uniref:FFLEELY motif protein n=1 Tax=Piscinibacter sp. TaxID=1903157 RepID=UPI002ED52BBA
MSASADSILTHLRTVDAERRRRAASPELAVRVHGLKAYQQRRFAHGYEDLLRSTRYGPAARFFLDELYGPRDFSERDAQFARVVPALVRLFPQEIVATVDVLAELHALSEVLDTATAGHLADAHVDAAGYVRAWQTTGHAADREMQVALTLRVGESLDRLTRNPLLRHTLRMMRGPAKAAGLGELQRFLESGFDTFKAMNGAREFLATVGSRERAFGRALFSADPGHLGDIALGQLP